MVRKVLSRIKILDYGRFYKWEIRNGRCEVTTEGFTSMTEGINILKKEISLKRKSSNRDKVKKE